MSQIPYKKVLAHRIIYGGKTYPMSIAEISDEGKEVSITPYTQETPNTAFINGAIEIQRDSDGKIIIMKNEE